MMLFKCKLAESKAIYEANRISHSWGTMQGLSHRIGTTKFPKDIDLHFLGCNAVLRVMVFARKRLGGLEWILSQLCFLY